MKLDEIKEKYRLGLVHNPNHFYPNSFEIEEDGIRLILTGRVKGHIKKGFRIVAILKPKRN